jgi:hypothetical protein
MRAAKRDINEPEIVDALKGRGFLVMRLHEFDLLSFDPIRQRLDMWEVKGPKGRLTSSQEKLIADGWPLNIIRTPEEL